MYIIQMSRCILRSSTIATTASSPPNWSTASRGTRTTSTRQRQVSCWFKPRQWRPRIETPPLHSLLAVGPFRYLGLKLFFLSYLCTYLFSFSKFVQSQITKYKSCVNWTCSIENWISIIFNAWHYWTVTLTWWKRRPCDYLLLLYKFTFSPPESQQSISCVGQYC